MSRRLVIALASAATVAAVLLPLALAAWLAHQQSAAAARAQLERRAGALARTVGTVLTRVGDGLARTDGLPLRCTPAVIRRLREVAFDLPEVAETGLMRPDGTLFCSSWGPIDPPETFAIEPIVGSLSLKGPVEARVVGRRVLVAERPRPDGGWANALIQPRALVGVAAGELAGTDFLALLGAASARPLAAVGLVPELQARADTDRGGAAQWHFGDGIERVVIERPVPGFPQLRVLAATSRSAVREALWGTLALPLALALVLSAALTAAIVRLAGRRLSLRGELARAVGARQLRVRYQPIVDVPRRRCVGVEALLRWHHESQGEIRPDLFVPLAEETGLIADVTRITLERVVADLSPLLRDDPGFHVAVNMAPAHLTDRALLPLLDRVVLSAPVQPRQVVLEFSERAFIAADAPQVRQALAAVAERGLSLALDDFGAGYSSLARLQGVPLRYIKVDRHFVAAIGAEAASVRLVDAIVEIAAGLGVPVVAEGVETDEQLAYLGARGVTCVQGFYYARPLSLPQLFQFFREFEEAARAEGARAGRDPDAAST